jgi:transposase
VRQALSSAVPPPRKRMVRVRPKLEPAVAFIDQILKTDQQAPRKQRHTAHRIYQRIDEELKLQVSEGAVRRLVRERKDTLGLRRPEVYIPQAHAPGQTGEADWYEAYVTRGGERHLVQVFSLRSCYSGDALHVAFERATQQAFLQALEAGFAFVGGVFRVVRFDNLRSAVQKILRGRQREETERFIAFRSHWGFEASFCNPGRGNEKGGVEGEVRRFRRNYFVPLPVIESLEELNLYLRAECTSDRQRRIAERAAPVGEMAEQERAQLRPLIGSFGLEEWSDHGVDNKSRVTVRTNRYSVPVRLAGRQVQARVSAQYVTLYYEGQEVACHERRYGRGQERLQLDHYLEVLLRKPGALAGSVPLAQMRAEGHWPQSYDRMWHGLKVRYGESEGTRQMVRLLMLVREQGAEALRAGIEDALAWACFDASAVELMMTRRAEGWSAPSTLDVGTLAIYDRPGPNVSQYDQLLLGGKEVTIQ